MTNEEQELPIVCNECGMTIESVNEYHPYAACLMYKQCNDSSIMRANLDAVVAHGFQACCEDNTQQDAARYRYLRNKDLNTISSGGIFAGITPENIVLNGADLDMAIDKELK